MGSHLKENLRNGQKEVRGIEKMYSSIKRMMSIISPELSS